MPLISYRYEPMHCKSTVPFSTCELLYKELCGVFVICYMMVFWVCLSFNHDNAPQPTVNMPGNH